MKRTFRVMEEPDARGLTILGRGAAFLETLAQEETRESHGMVFKCPEYLEAYLLVEAARLKFEGIEPDTCTAICPRNFFCFLHEHRPEMLSAVAFGHCQKFHEQPIVSYLSPDAAHVVTFIVGQENGDRADTWVTCLADVVRA